MVTVIVVAAEENVDGDGVIEKCVGYDGGTCGVTQSIIAMMVILVGWAMFWLRFDEDVEENVCW